MTTSLATLVRAIATKMLAAGKNCSGNGRWWSHGEWFECRDCRDVRRALAALDAEQGGEVGG